MNKDDFASCFEVAVVRARQAYLCPYLYTSLISPLILHTLLYHSISIFSWLLYA